MKKLLLSLLTMLICWFAAVSSSAQNTLTVADGAATNGHVPIYGYYVDEYVKSQTIYPASMIASMSGQTITAITFYFYSPPADPWGADFRVMLKEVSDSVFASATFEATSLNDMVYMGPMNDENGVISIDLDYPFAYNGGNLLLEVSSANTGDYSSCTFQGMAADFASVQGYDASGINYIIPEIWNFIPKTTFEYGVVSLCSKAHSLSASNITSNSATISWLGSSNATSYVVEYMPASYTDWDNDAIQTTTTSTSINLTNLTPTIPYVVRVKVICSDNTETAWSNPYTFIPGAYIMTPDGNATMTTCGLMIYDDGGANNDYSVDCNSTLVLIPEDPNAKIMLTGTCNTETNWDHLYIYDGIGTTGFELADYTGTYDVSVISISGPLTIHFTSDGTVTYPGFALLAQCVSCYPPTNITATNTTMSGATISWSGNASGYAIYLNGATNGYYTTTDTFYTFTGLTPSSMYSVQIRSLCGSDSSILSDVAAFNTSCDAITVTMDNPWVEDFENYLGDGLQPYICWSTPTTYVTSNGTFPTVNCGNGQACHSGVNSGEFKGSNNLLVLPEFTNDIADLRLSFWATATTVTSGSVEVGYVTDALDATSFVAIANAGVPGPRGSANAGNGNYMGPFDFNGVTASGARIALRYTNISSLTASWNVDDFSVELSPNCPSPVKTSVTASDIDGHSATISWVDNDDTHSSWTVFYRESNAAATDPWMSQTANSTTASITGLDPETAYDVYVITNCGSTFANPDATLTITFTTTIACPAPSAITLANITTNEATITWTSTASSFNVEYGPVGFTPGTGISTIETNNTVTISGLMPSTAYTVIVGADCGGDDGVSSTVSLNFTTTQNSVELPYTANFTDPNDTWILDNGNCANFWTTGLVNNEPALFVTNDSITPGYNITSVSVVTAEKLFNVGEHAAINISFDLVAGGESNYDYVKVFFAPATQSYPASTTGTIYSQYSYSTYALNFQDYLPQTGNTSYPYKINLTQGNTIHVETEVVNPNENPDPTSTAKLVFLWKNDLSAGTQPAAIISNVHVSVNGCPSPTALADSNLTTSSADIYWTPGETESEWEVEYGLHGFAQGTGTLETVYGSPNITLTTLATATAYDVYVRAMCSAADSSLWVGPLTFVTACDIFTTYPYVENFDSYSVGSTSRPNCWSFPVIFNNAAPYITNSYSTSPSNSLFFQSAIADHTTAVSPQFDADINTLRVKFMLKAEHTNYSGTFEVGVMSDPFNLSTFESAAIIQPENTAWNEYTVDLNTVTMTGPNRYIAFRQNSNSDNWYYWMDDVRVSLIPSCAEPSEVHVEGSTPTSITLGWTANGGETSWNIEYGPAGHTLGNGTVLTANTNPFTIDNLIPNLNYDFYVQAECSVDDQSIWVGPFTIAPGTYLMPISGTYTISACDLTIYDDGGPNNSYSSSCNSTLTIYPTDSTNRIAIQGTLSTENCCDYLRIYDGENINAPLLGEYKGVGITIPEMISTSGPLTLYFYSDPSLVFSGFQLTVSCYSNFCPPPADLVVSNISTNSADLSWTPAGNETNWNLEYKEASASTWTSVVVSGTASYQLTNLNTGTTYEVRVQADCGDEQSMWVTNTFNTNCEVITTFPYTEDFENAGNMPSCWTQNFVIGTVEWTAHTGNNTSITNAHSGSYNAYFFYGSSTENNTTLLISPVFDLTNVPNPYLSYWYSQDEWGSDIDRLSVYYRTSANSQWDLLAQYTNAVDFWTMDSLTLPNPSATYQIAFEGFAAYGYGITLDDITIAAGNDPGPIITDPTVATTAATAIGQHTATLNGNITNPDSVTITAKGFEWKATTGGTYAPVTVTGDNLTYNLTGLTANTSYTFKAFITFNGNTVYGEEMTFTTLEDVPQPCDVPTGLHATSFGGDYITIAWNGNPNVSSWNIQYRPVGGTLASATSPTNSYTISGLESETTYEIQVQADCGNGNVSEWSTAITATTTVGIENYLLNSISLYPNPTNDVINVQCTMNNVQVTALEVFDVYGKLINTVNVIDNPTQINVSNLAAGMYFVRVTTEEGVVTKSFVKK